MDATTLWSTTRKAAASFNEHNDCTVTAVTICSGLDYADVHAAFAAAGRKRGKGVNRGITRAACRSLGLEMKRVDRRIKAKTAITIERERSLQSGSYIIGMTRHLAAMVDGKLIDHTKGRRKQVNGVYELHPIQGTDAPASEPVPFPPFKRYTKQDQIPLF